MNPLVRQPDLFPVYPDIPGARATDTSMAAADGIAEAAPLLRDRVLDLIERAGSHGLTPDEAAIELELTPFTTRPRFSELASMGEIKDSDQRRENASGRKAIVWIAAHGRSQ